MGGCLEWAFGRWLGLDEIVRLEPTGISAFIRQDTTEPTLCHLPWGGHSEKAAICKQRRAVTEETKPATPFFLLFIWGPHSLQDQSSWNPCRLQWKPRVLIPAPHQGISKQQHLDCTLLASRTVRNKFLLFKPPSLWYSVIEALANEYITKVIDRFTAISNAVASVVQIKA